MQDDILSAARDYLSRSWSVIPIPSGKKVPIIKGWQKLQLKDEQLAEHFGHECNIGVLLGSASNGLIDIDFDVPEAVVAGGVVLPATATFGRPGAPQSHRLYRSAQTRRRTAWQDADGTTILELRADGSQTVFPPSLHPSGERIAWSQDRPCAKLEADELHRLATLVAVASVLARAYPEPGGRNDFTLAVSGALLQAGLSVSEAETTVRAMAMAAGDEEIESRVATVATTQRRLDANERVVSWGRLQEAIGPQRNKRLRRWLLASQGSDTDDSRPLIPVSGRHLRDQTDDALSALLEANDPPQIFVRSGLLVRVLSDEVGQPMVDDLSVDGLRMQLARAANCVRQAHDRWVPVAPPPDVVRDLLALGKWDFPALVGLVQNPVLRDDGSILDTPGYDPLSRLIYWPHAGFQAPPIAAEPSAADLERALDLILNELLVDFRFRDQPSRANAVALLLTPFVRQAATGPAPLAVVSAPLQGTGKSWLATVFTIVASGRRPAMMPAPTNEDEMRKRITSALRVGHTVIVIDNIAHPLSSESLAVALSEEIYTDRILGHSEMTELPQRATWVLTGNNVRLQGDLPRRCFWITMDAKTVRPWMRRDFRHPDLDRWASVHRAELVWALLVLCRSWWAHGRPPADVPALGGYRGWVHTVGGILAHAGIDGFLGNLEESYELGDDEAEQWGTFLGAWWTAEGDEPFSAADMLDVLRGGPAIAEAAPPAVGELLKVGVASPAAGLGGVLSREADRRYTWGKQQVYVTRAPRDTHAKKNRWRVVVEDFVQEELF